MDIPDQFLRGRGLDAESRAILPTEHVQQEPDVAGVAGAEPEHEIDDHIQSRDHLSLGNRVRSRAGLIFLRKLNLAGELGHVEGIVDLAEFCPCVSDRSCHFEGETETELLDRRVPVSLADFPLILVLVVLGELEEIELFLGDVELQEVNLAAAHVLLAFLDGSVEAREAFHDGAHGIVGFRAGDELRLIRSPVEGLDETRGFQKDFIPRGRELGIGVRAETHGAQFEEPLFSGCHFGEELVAGDFGDFADGSVFHGINPFQKLSFALSRAHEPSHNQFVRSQNEKLPLERGSDYRYIHILQICPSPSRDCVRNATARSDRDPIPSDCAKQPEGTHKDVPKSANSSHG